MWIFSEPLCVALNYTDHNYIYFPRTVILYVLTLCEFSVYAFLLLYNHIDRNCIWFPCVLSLCEHKGIKYNCNQCDYKATVKYTLNMHIRVESIWTMIQEQRVILKLIGYGEERSYNDIVAKYHSKGTARWPIWATHHSQGTAAASAASASHAPGAGAAPPAGGAAPAGGVQRSISPQVLTKAWRPPLQCRQSVVCSLPWWYKYLRYPLWARQHCRLTIWK